MTKKKEVSQMQIDICVEHCELLAKHIQQFDSLSKDAKAILQLIEEYKKTKKESLRNFTAYMEVSSLLSDIHLKIGLFFRPRHKTEKFKTNKKKNKSNK